MKLKLSTQLSLYENEKFNNITCCIIKELIKLSLTVQSINFFASLKINLLTFLYKTQSF